MHDSVSNLQIYINYKYFALKIKNTVTVNKQHFPYQGKSQIQMFSITFYAY